MVIRIAPEWQNSRTVPERLTYWAERTPHRPFVKCGSDWLTFNDVEAQVNALSAGLQGHGIRQGDCVAIMLPNCVEYLLSILALARVGAVQVPVNPYLKGQWLRHPLQDSKASVLIGDEPSIARCFQAGLDTTNVRTIVGVGSAAKGNSSVVRFSTLMEVGQEPTPVNQSFGDLLTIMYTSGTTGNPKGCMLSHGYYMTMPLGSLELQWVVEGDRLYTALPMFHAGGGAFYLMVALQAGLPIAYATEFHASTFIQEVAEVDATVVFGVGAMAHAILRAPPHRTDRAHRLRLAGWFPLDPATQEAFEARFAVDVATGAYGQTECLGVIMSSPDDRSRREGLGRAVSGYEVKLVDRDDREVPPGEVGEIVVRSHDPERLFSGYWNAPEATVRTWRNLWHHTGDLAVCDENGYCTFVDRKQDAIRRRGENISSIQVETVIGDHPKIAAVAVAGVASPLGEDDVKAWIVLAPEERLEPDELHEYLRGALPYFAVPRYVQFVDELPVTPTGRVQKHKLRVTDGHSSWDFDELGLRVEKADRR